MLELVEAGSCLVVNVLDLPLDDESSWSSPAAVQWESTRGKHTQKRAPRKGGVVEAVTELAPPVCIPLRLNWGF